MPRPFIVYHPQPPSRGNNRTTPGLTIVRCDYADETFMQDLLEIACNKLSVDLGTGWFLKPEALARDPIDTLYTRTNEWLRHNLTVAQWRIHSVYMVSEYFPDRESQSKQIDLLLVDDEIIEALDTVGDLQFRPTRVLRESKTEIDRRMGYIPSLSDGIKTAGGVEKALDIKNGIIHDGRPENNYGPPPALFHPALAKLDHHLRHLDDDLQELVPEPAFLRHTHEFIAFSTRVYASEADRAEALHPVLGNIFGLYKTEKPFPGAKVDMLWEDDHANVIVITEIQNECGIGGDASLQTALAYAKIVTDTEYSGKSPGTNHPVILIGLMGDLIEIASAVLLSDGVYRDRLLSQRLQLGFHAHDHVIRLAQAFRAVALATISIRGFYNNLRDHPLPQNSLAHKYPSPTYLDGEQPPFNLKFHCRLSRAGTTFALPEDDNQGERAEDRRSSLYIAFMSPRSDASTASSSLAAPAPADAEVVVKFTTRYNADAHRLLASAGYAPQLYACAAVYGGLYMVVMERFHGKTMGYWQHNGIRVPRTIYTDVNAAIKLLHQARTVFGDLRLHNVMCVSATSGPDPPDPGNKDTKPGDKAKLLDFDWAGEVGKAKYPATLNDSLPDWCPGAQRYAVMRLEHDLEMLKELERHCEDPVVSEDSDAMST